MRVVLKGINTVGVTLASGKRVTYHYAWKGGPRLEGAPGDPEFIASYNEAVKNRRSDLQPKTIFTFLTDGYRDSQEFAKLAPRTQADYSKLLRSIDAEFGDFPIRLLADRRSRADFLAWRDKLAKRSRRQADYAWTVLARVMSWAVDRGLAPDNPCTKAGRLYSGTRADKVWTADDEAAFAAKASSSLNLALQLALWTGQRQGDLLRLTWFAYDGACIRLQQGKTGVRVTIPIGAPMRAILDHHRVGAAKGDKILRNTAGGDWTPDGFRASWGKACRSAGISGVTFHDLRGTAVSHLHAAGCTEAEIATITGHSLRDVRSILDANYFHRDVALAESGIAKLEKARMDRDRVQVT